MFYVVEPEVAGGFGENTSLTRTPGKPMVVHKLHYKFDGWLGDALLESAPCYIVTEQLANHIQRSQLSGVVFDDVEVTVSQQFRDFYPNRTLPKFIWLKMDGQFGRDDFGIAPGLRLVVSERALEVLKNGGISHAEISHFNDGIL